MRNTLGVAIGMMLGCVLAAAADKGWNPAAAATYLDQRQEAWFGWAPAKSQGGPCLSCHTGLPYLLARPRLRAVLGQKEPGRFETGLLNGLRARLAQPVGEGARAEQAAGVEAVFAALLLTRAEGWSPDAQRAFDRLWARQVRSGPRRGAWAWYDFGTDPFETADSVYFGAALAAMAVEAAPAEYRARAEVRDLKEYLVRAYDGQPLHNRLLAANVLPEKLRAAVRTEAFEKQDADGHWPIAALGPWAEHAGAPAAEQVTAYATAYTAYALRVMRVDAGEPHLAKALGWLKAHQDRKDGSWAAGSMNKQRPAGTMAELFMRDASTAFAVMALAPGE